MIRERERGRGWEERRRRKERRRDKRERRSNTERGEKLKKGRKQRALLFVLGTQSLSQKDRARLNYVSQQALCEGVAVAVVTVGSRFNRTQVEKMASPPVDQHRIHLDRIKTEQQDYARRFFRVLLSALGKRVNTYPPPSVQRSCGQFQGQTGSGPQIVDDQEVLEEEEEQFLEHTGPGQVHTDPGQVQDLSHTWTRGDGQTFVSSCPRSRRKVNVTVCLCV
ncbi:hypothetical protein WMY93_032958 [Mugilogobius chulae]|uniref:AIG1-type G domain-containing protein n=1 Tax=Mugilogobius chulae TaxID=88201 RepID=A0AAW0MVA3_9GOBI